MNVYRKLKEVGRPHREECSTLPSQQQQGANGGERLSNVAILPIRCDPLQDVSVSYLMRLDELYRAAAPRGEQTATDGGVPFRFPVGTKGF